MPGWHNSYNLNIIGTWNLWNLATAPISHPLPRQPRGLAHGPGKVQRLRQARPFSSDNEAEFFNEKNWKAGSVSMISNLHMDDVTSLCLGWQGADHSLTSSQDAINGYTASAQRIIYCSIVWYYKIFSCLLAASCYRLTILQMRSVFLVDDSLQGTSGEAVVASWRV